MSDLRAALRFDYRDGGANHAHPARVGVRTCFGRCELDDVVAGSERVLHVEIGQFDGAVAAGDRRFRCGNGPFHGRASIYGDGLVAVGEGSFHGLHAVVHSGHGSVCVAGRT